MNYRKPLIGLTLFVQRTRLGKAMRATAQDRTAAAMMGMPASQGRGQRVGRLADAPRSRRPSWPAGHAAVHAG